MRSVIGLVLLGFDSLVNAKQKLGNVARRRTPSFELHGGSKETKIPKKWWFVAHVLYVFNLYIF